MKDPIEVIKKHLYSARDMRNYHRARQRKGEVEASLAGHKMMWMREILHEITGELISLKDLG